MTAEIRDPAFKQVVGAAIRVECLATGFAFTEGPIWHPRESYLTFSDIPGYHMRRWVPGGGITTFRKPSNMANGNTYDQIGRMLTCEHATILFSWSDPNRTIPVFPTRYPSRALNCPNHIVPRM